MKNFLKRLHRDNAGAISVETILILAAIAVPLLIIIALFGQKIKDWFNEKSQNIEQNRL